MQPKTVLTQPCLQHICEMSFLGCRAWEAMQLLPVKWENKSQEVDLCLLQKSSMILK